MGNYNIKHASIDTSYSVIYNPDNYLLAVQWDKSVSESSSSSCCCYYSFYDIVTLLILLLVLFVLCHHYYNLLDPSFYLFISLSLDLSIYILFIYLFMNQIIFAS